PANAFMLAMFCGWIFHRHVLRDEIGIRSAGGYRLFSFLVRYVAPLGVGAVLIASLVGTQF
ncbi:MAG: sodium-dependent transporter, partial [Gammaproteobacteria bacterium]|nr:sodium-dependent transporter [Gammaproteobacteria bacterium]